MIKKITQTKTGKYKDLFDKDSFVCGKESAADNFARGYKTEGRALIDQVIETLRSMIENCSNLQGFMITHSIGGGTGSGFTKLLLEKMEYRKPKPQIPK